MEQLKVFFTNSKHHEELFECIKIVCWTIEALEDREEVTYKKYQLLLLTATWL